MNLHDRYRQSEEIIPQWQLLETAEQFEAAIALSHQKPVVFFKHSTRCGISAHAKYRLEQDWSFSPEELELFYLDLIAYRPISNQIAHVLHVVHQSPQVIMVRNGKAVFDTSHHSISISGLRTALEAIG